VNHADYRYAGFPTGLAAGLDALAANGLLRGLSLPAFLIEAYISDHFTRTSSDQDPIDLDTMTFKHVQSETNVVVGSRFSYRHIQRICLIWADLCRPEAKPYFVEPTYR